MIWANLDTNGFPGCWSGGWSSQLDQEVSWMGFINSPITNLDVSAVLGVRSKSVFTRGAQTPFRTSGCSCPSPPPGEGAHPPLALDAELSPNSFSLEQRRCFKTRGSARTRGLSSTSRAPRFPCQYAESRKVSNSDPLLRGALEYAQAFSPCVCVCEFYVPTNLKDVFERPR